MPDNPPVIHAKVDDLLQQARMATSDLTSSDKARSEGIGVLAGVIDQQREVIHNLIAEQEDLREAHREEVVQLEKRAAQAEAGKSEAVSLAEKAVGRATAAESRMTEMTIVFDKLVSSISDRNRVLIEEDRSIEAIVKRSGVQPGSNGPRPAIGARLHHSRPHKAPEEVHIPAFLTVGHEAGAVADVVAPAAGKVIAPPTAGLSLLRPPATPLGAPAHAAASTSPLTTPREADDVFAEASPAEALSSEERGEERRAFAGAMDAFRGLLGSRARTPLSQTQEA